MRLPPLRVGELLQRLGDLAAVERIALGRRNGLQRPRRGLEAEEFADLRRAAPGQEALREARLRLQDRRGRGPLLLHHRRHQVAALGDLDGRRHEVREGQLAEALGHRDPAADGARHRDRIDAALRRRAASAPYLRRKYSGVQAAGAQPEPLSPCSFLPSHRMQKASLPRPLLTGSSTVIAAAVAIAASTALPP